MAKVEPIKRKSVTGLNYLIRSPLTADAEQIIALARSVADEKVYQVSEADEFSMTIDEEKSWIQKINESECSLALVAEVEGQVVGFLDFHANSRRRRLAHTGAFGMSVSKEFRDQSIGTSLIRVLLDWARANEKVEKVSLTVLASNERAIHLYEKLGFLIEGKRVKEVKIAPEQYVDDILMYQFVKG